MTPPLRTPHQVQVKDGIVTEGGPAFVLDKGAPVAVTVDLVAFTPPEPDEPPLARLVIGNIVYTRSQVFATARGAITARREDVLRLVQEYRSCLKRLEAEADLLDASMARLANETHAPPPAGEAPAA